MKTFEFVDGENLAGSPRFSVGGHSILFGPYNSAQSHDSHFATTFGSGDPIFDSTNELRFSKTSGVLVSCRVGVPENPTHGDVFLSLVNRLPVRLAVPRLPIDTQFQFAPATHTEINDDGTDLVIYRGEPEQVTTRIGIGADLEILLGNDEISGFLLHNPSAYLVYGWPFSSPVISDRALGKILSQYLRTIDSDFVERLEDADSEACNRLTRFHREASQLAPSPQRDVLVRAINDVRDIFCV